MASIVAIAALSVVPSSAQAVSRDRDRDGLNNRYELLRSHTSPRRADTDGDHLRDGFEVRRSNTNPLAKDTDADGLTDGYELLRSKTSPRLKDTDRDGTADGVELLLGTNPLRAPTRGKKKGIEDPPLQLPDTTPPETTITSGPSGTVASSGASFSFSSSEAGSSFTCQLDTGSWGSCSSPKAYSGLADGAHAFKVRATDAAGNGPVRAVRLPR